MGAKLNKLEEEVMAMADEASAEILPLLYERLIQKNGLSICEKHSMLGVRISAEIALTKAKRKYMGDNPINGVFTGYHENLAKYDTIKNNVLHIRKEYRSKPCTCWVEKR